MFVSEKGAILQRILYKIPVYDREPVLLFILYWATENFTMT